MSSSSDLPVDGLQAIVPVSAKYVLQSNAEFHPFAPRHKGKNRSRVLVLQVPRLAQPPNASALGEFRNTPLGKAYFHLFLVFLRIVYYAKKVNASFALFYEDVLGDMDRVARLVDSKLLTETLELTSKIGLSPHQEELIMEEASSGEGSAAATESALASSLKQEDKDSMADIVKEWPQRDHAYLSSSPPQEFLTAKSMICELADCSDKCSSSCGYRLVMVLGSDSFDPSEMLAELFSDNLSRRDMFYGETGIEEITASGKKKTRKRARRRSKARGGDDDDEAQDAGGADSDVEFARGKSNYAKRAKSSKPMGAEVLMMLGNLWESLTMDDYKRAVACKMGSFVTESEPEPEPEPERDHEGEHEPAGSRERERQENEEEAEEGEEEADDEEDHKAARERKELQSRSRGSSSSSSVGHSLDIRNPSSPLSPWNVFHVCNMHEDLFPAACYLQVDVYRYLNTEAPVLEDLDEVRDRMRSASAQKRMREISSTAENFCFPPEVCKRVWKFPTEFIDPAMIMQTKLATARDTMHPAASPTAHQDIKLIMQDKALIDFVTLKLCQQRFYMPEDESRQHVAELYTRVLVESKQVRFNTMDELGEFNKKTLEHMQKEYMSKMSLARSPESKRKIMQRHAELSWAFRLNALREFQSLANHSMSPHKLVGMMYLSSAEDMFCQPALKDRHISAIDTWIADFLYELELVHDMGTSQDAALTILLSSLASSSDTYHHVHVLLTGGTDTSKSWAALVIYEMLLEKSAQSHTRWTPAAFTDPGDFSGCMEIFNETPAVMLGLKSGKNSNTGNTAQTDVLNKIKDSHSDSGKVVTTECVMDKKYGRLTRRHERNVKGSLVFISNAHLSDIDPTIKSRFLTLQTDRRERSDRKIISMITNSNKHEMDRFRSYLIAQARKLQAVMIVANALIRVSLIRKPTMPVMNLLVEKVFSSQTALDKLPCVVQNRKVKLLMALNATLVLVNAIILLIRSPLSPWRGRFDPLGHHVPEPFKHEHLLSLDLNLTDKSLSVCATAFHVGRNMFLPHILSDVCQATMKAWFPKASPSFLLNYIDVDSETMTFTVKPVLLQHLGVSADRLDLSILRSLNLHLDCITATTSTSSTSSSSSSSSSASSNSGLTRVVKPPLPKPWMFSGHSVLHTQSSYSVPALLQQFSKKEREDPGADTLPPSATTSSTIPATEMRDLLQSKIPKFRYGMPREEQEHYTAAVNRYYDFVERLEDKVRHVQMLVLSSFLVQVPVRGTQQQYLLLPCNGKASSQTPSDGTSGAKKAFQRMHDWAAMVAPHMHSLPTQQDMRYFLDSLRTLKAPEMDAVTGKATAPAVDNAPTLVVWDNENVYLHKWVILSLASHQEALRDCLRDVLRSEMIMPQLLLFGKGWTSRIQDSDYYTPFVIPLASKHGVPTPPGASSSSSSSSYASCSSSLAVVRKRRLPVETLAARMRYADKLHRGLREAVDKSLDSSSALGRAPRGDRSWIPIEVLAHFMRIEHVPLSMAVGFNALPHHEQETLWMKYSDDYREEWKRRKEILCQHFPTWKVLAAMAARPSQPLDAETSLHGDMALEDMQADIDKQDLLVPEEREEGENAEPGAVGEDPEPDVLQTGLPYLYQVYKDMDADQILKGGSGSVYVYGSKSFGEVDIDDSKPMDLEGS